MTAREPSPIPTDEIAARVEALGPWFHNMRLDGVDTAPQHFLGDYPRVKWRHIGPALPDDLSGLHVLDIGCNAGFHAIEMKRRRAERVLGIDTDTRYLEQARFAACVCGVDIEFRRMSVYDIAAIGERFDIVLFMGLLYHLRHPLLALDLIATHVVRDLLVVQSLVRGSPRVAAFDGDYDLRDAAPFERAEFPRLHFVEQSYGGDPTNWWIPNRACVEAMLRSAGFDLIARPESETYVCRRSARGDARTATIDPPEVT